MVKRSMATVLRDKKACGRNTKKKRPREDWGNKGQLNGEGNDS